jgi:hypothetical protein
MHQDIPAVLEDLLQADQGRLHSSAVSFDYVVCEWGDYRDYELSNAVLTHINLLIHRGAYTESESDFKHFFCKYDKPSYIKIDILGLVASDNNIVEILAELSEYVIDVDAELSKRSILAIALTGARLRDSVEPS